MKGKCREEAPKHTMPFPFEDFDCSRYIIVPKDCAGLKKETINSVVTLAIGKALEEMIGLIDCEIKLASIKLKDKKGVCVEFAIVTMGRNQVAKTKKITVIVDLEENVAKLA